MTTLRSVKVGGGGGKNMRWVYQTSKRNNKMTKGRIVSKGEGRRRETSYQKSPTSVAADGDVLTGPAEKKGILWMFVEKQKIDKW